jgi:hypothetical protein
VLATGEAGSLPHSSALSKGQKPKLLTPPMETKQTTRYTTRQAEIKLWSSSIRVTDASGDVVEIDYESSAFKTALSDYVQNTLSKTEQQSLIALCTNTIREREEREAKWAAEAK